MKATARRLVLVWVVGAVFGTAVIAVTSPLFVRSYVPLVSDPLRGVWTLAPGYTYRWRSEGYANTQIGPHGMPGKTAMESVSEPGRRVALWGDSQAEGVCVSDSQKLFAQIEQASASRMKVLPLARSGEDAADWVTQMPAVDEAFGVDLHVLLIVDLPDLLAAVDAPLPPPSESDIVLAQNAVAARLPAFVIQAARHLLTEADGATRRRLRFGIGPEEVENLPQAPPQASTGRANWDAAVQVIRQATRKPIVVLYAPKVPQIADGKIVTHDRHRDQFSVVADAAERHDIFLIDARDALRQSAQRDIWPHGFHNGQIGNGHLNFAGNRLLAALLTQHTDTDLAGRGK